MTNDISRKQVARYNVKRNVWAIIAMSLFVIDALCVLLFNVLDATIVLAIMGILSILAFVAALQIKDVSKTERLAVATSPFDVDTAKIMAGCNAGNTLYDRHGKPATSDSNAADCYMMSFEANHDFVRFPVYATISDTSYSLPEEVIPYAGILKEDRNKEFSALNASRADKDVTGLASDITPELFGSDHPTITVNHLTRYAVQVTDDAFNKIIINKKKISDKIVFNGHDLALTKDGHLKAFADSKMANEIDIHSLIISNDGYLMLARGTEDHPLRAGQIIASASCSLLPDEIEAKPIQESMVGSIHAKIRKSFIIPDSTDIQSSFCGFARMIQRGGAPEFYCITRIGMSKDELVCAHCDATSTFMYDLPCANMQIDLSNNDDIRQQLADYMQQARKVADNDIAVSASALFMSVEEAMGDMPTAGKIMRRIGIIEDEADVY